MGVPGGVAKVPVAAGPSGQGTGFWKGGFDGTFTAHVPSGMRMTSVVTGSGPGGLRCGSCSAPQPVAIVTTNAAVSPGTFLRFIAPE